MMRQKLKEPWNVSAVGVRIDLERLPRRNWAVTTAVQTITSIATIATRRAREADPIAVFYAGIIEDAEMPEFTGLYTEKRCNGDVRRAASRACESRIPALFLARCGRSRFPKIHPPFLRSSV
jgi:hypothetical protein